MNFSQPFAHCFPSLRRKKHIDGHEFEFPSEFISCFVMDYNRTVLLQKQCSNETTHFFHSIRIFSLVIRIKRICIYFSAINCVVRTFNRICIIFARENKTSVDSINARVKKKHCKIIDIFILNKNTAARVL